MKTASVNIIDNYYGLLKNLSPDNKLELIARLSNSMKSKEQTKNGSLRSLFGSFISEKSAEELIKDIKQARHFTRKRAEF